MFKLLEEIPLYDFLFLYLGAIVLSSYTFIKNFEKIF